MTKLGKHAVVLGASMGGLLAARVRRLKRLLIKKRAAIRVLDRPINGPRSGWRERPASASWHHSLPRGCVTMS